MASSPVSRIEYDVMNDVMSVGIHRLWKDAMMDWLAPRRGVNGCWMWPAGPVMSRSGYLKRAPELDGHRPRHDGIDADRRAESGPKLKTWLIG